jgi:hypothetical protein
MNSGGRRTAGTEARPGQLSGLIVGRASPPDTRVRASHLWLRGPIRPITPSSSVAPGGAR